MKLVTICDRLKPLKHSSAPATVFTEQGVTQLSTVLHSDVAVEMSIRINDAFHAMRHCFGGFFTRDGVDGIVVIPGHALESQPHPVIPGLTRNLLSLLSQYALDYGKHRLHLYDGQCQQQCPLHRRYQRPGPTYSRTR